jgi:hypothetical protein
VEIVVLLAGQGLELGSRAEHTIPAPASEAHSTSARACPRTRPA